MPKINTEVIKIKDRYVVEFVQDKDCVMDCNTIEDLSRYLDKDPHPEYRLVNALTINGSFILIWELQKEAETEPETTVKMKKIRKAEAEDIVVELKTLKDFEINDKLFQLAQAEESNNQIIVAKNKLHPEGDFIRLNKPIVLSYELRQEAIKDIKNPELLSLKADLDLEIEVKAVIKYIKWKFNITEEDITGKIKPDEHLPSARGIENS